MASVPTKSRLFPAKLAQVLGETPLAINERREDYNKLIDAIADAVKPQDAIAWIYVRNIVDLLWDAQREKKRKVKIIQSAQIIAVANLLTPAAERRDPYGCDQAFEVALSWARYGVVREYVDKLLLKVDRNIDADDVMRLALEAPYIDSIDKSESHRTRPAI